MVQNGSRPKGLRKVADVMRHPLEYSERARWKTKHFLNAARKTWIDAPPWVRAYNRREEVLDFGPALIYLETASACNLRCPMCPTGLHQITRKHGFMKMDLVRKFADEIRHVPQQVGMWLGGEPLLNKGLTEMVAFLASKGLPVGMHTNATLLNTEISRELVEAKLRFISFSLDGPDEESYAKMRVGGDFHQTVQNINDFLKIKEQYGNPGPIVVVQTVIPYQNDEVHPYGVQLETDPRIKELFEGLPVDEYKTMLTHGWSGQMDDVEFATPNHSGQGQRIACDLPYTSMTIGWDGKAVTCCGDINNKGVLGNLYEENLYDLWNNESYQKLRRDMHTEEIEKHPMCGTCERLWTKPHRNDYELRLFLGRYKMRL